jgi:hypothetical protein
MHIREMRSALDAANAGKGMPELPATMPDWAVRRVYEFRSSLPLTDAPAAAKRAALAFWNRHADALGRQVRSMQKTLTKRTVAADAASESEREAMQRRIRAAQIAFLN